MSNWSRLSKAEEMKLKSVAFPNLGGGVFGFPKDLAAENLVRSCYEYTQNQSSKRTVNVIKFMNVDYTTVIKILLTGG